MERNITEVVFILDKSGSMSGLEKDTIGGYNSMLERQKKEEGEVLISTVLFSNHSKVIHNRVKIEKVSPITDKEYYVGGGTALLDAMGNAIDHISKIQEKNIKKTLFVIITDGEENASEMYTYGLIKRMIKEKKEKGQEFIFLGANIDAIVEAERFGIEEERAVNFNCDEEVVALNYQVISETITLALQ